MRLVVTAFLISSNGVFNRHRLPAGNSYMWARLSAVGSAYVETSVTELEEFWLRVPLLYGLYTGRSNLV